MIKLRLRRMGAKKKPSYRIVVADARSKRDGRFVEIVGHYNPLTEPTTIVIKDDRARYWLGQGAQPTERVAKLLKIRGITDESGKATITVPLADSITTWRVSTLANAATGKLGGSVAGLRVFQDFFADIDFPASLTRAIPPATSRSPRA